MADLTVKRQGEVSRVQRVIGEIEQRDAFGHIHLKRELAAGNEYARSYLFARGYEYIDGAIVRTWAGRKEA